MSVLENVIALLLKKGIIVYKSQLSKSVYHIRIQSDIFKDIEYATGDFLRIFVGKGNRELTLGEKIRSYSIWNLNKERCQLDLAVTTLGNGPGTQWAIECRQGDAVYFHWHKGKFRLDSSTDNYVFIGDLSALPSLYEFSRNLNNKKIYSIIYSQDKEDFFADIDGKEPFEFNYLPQNPVDDVLHELQLIRRNIKHNTDVYVAGDSRICVAVTQFLRREWKWDSGRIKAKPYWNPIKTGLE